MMPRSPANPNGIENSLIQRLRTVMGLNAPPKRGVALKLIETAEALESRQLLSATGGNPEVLSYNFPIPEPAHDVALTEVDVQNQAFSVAENSIAGTVVGTVVASDPDTASPLTYEIIAGNTNGAFSINATNGKITVANAAALNYEAQPTFSLIVKVTDSTSPVTQDTATVTINVTNIDEPTTISLQSTPITYVIGGSPIQVDPSAQLIPDPDTPNVSFKGAKLTIGVRRPRPSDKDVIRILNGGYGPGEIHIGKTQILYEGNLIGTYRGGRGTSPDLVINFSSGATQAAVQALLRQIAFNTTSRIEVPPDRVLDFNLTNVSGQNSPTASRTVNVDRP